MQRRIAKQNRLSEEDKALKSKELKRDTKHPIPTVGQDDAYEVSNLKKGIKLHREEKGSFSIVDAQRMLAYPTFEGERPLRPEHVAILKLAYMEGIFREESVEIITAYNREDKQTYRMNGRHTSEMLVALQDEKDFKGTQLNVRQLAYIVEDFEAMRTLYSTIDRGAPRTSSHMIITLLVGIQGFENIPQDILKKLAEGFGTWFWPVRGRRRLHGPEHKAHLMKGDFKNVVLNVFKIFKDASKHDVKHMLKSNVMAAMIGTFRTNISKSEEFWSMVRDGLGFKNKNDPARQLREMLLEHGQKKKYSSDQIMMFCLYAWNWWMLGETGVLHNVRAKERPELIAREP
jgi:hypothetical protein